MHLKFTATFSLDDYKDHNVTKGDDLLLLRYDAEYRDKVRRELRKIVEKNNKNRDKDKPPVELDVDIDIHYMKRSLDQNAWLWVAHTLEAAIVNNKRLSGEAIQWNTPDEVTPQMIHDSYMEEFAPRGYVDVLPGWVDAIRKMIEETHGRVMNETWLPDKQVYRFEIWKTSSYMNVREFCELAEHVEDNLLSYGITLDNSVDFKHLIEDLQTIKNSDKGSLTEPKESAIVDKEMDIF